MHDVLKIAQKIVPEYVEILLKRYDILRTIYYNQPIGRRTLSNNLGLGERIVRTEISFFKEQNLIEINTPGMNVTKEGEEIINKLKDFVHELKGLSEIEKYIREKLGLKNIIVVPGNVDEDVTVFTELGKAAALYLKELIKDNSIIAITGGSTIKEVIDNMPKVNNLNNVLVVPARGGMGSSVETQANSLAASLAKKMGASYKLLHIPDNLSNNALSAMLNEGDVKEIVKNIMISNILIYGIGRADKMAERRGLSTEKLDELKFKGAVGEAFGYYFNADGQIICSTSTIVVDSESLKNIENLIAVAAGKNKAEAIISAEKNLSNSTLITDEGAAREIINIISKKE
ncbi:sugar-binding transcriptional regulator [Clostridium sp. YIM B02515]|uniref:Sugar-binding transcriptional regulator n=1 Tax=Clostridium rhizosphaerae TaxID=2803861 RepID=A0ABS1T7M3_9CLOT|nr:sugar-binding domain-containing protein [Clostridium rhizosphaerae]MBL4935343.1 sugar-binding transcriptional regulator [Clostridium rhizosphaerae]